MAEERDRIITEDIKELVLARLDLMSPDFLLAHREHSQKTSLLNM